MSIVKMKRLRLFGLQSDRDRLLSDLTLLGCVEVSEAENDAFDPEWRPLLKRGESSLAELKSRQMKISSALDTLKQYGKKKAGLFPARPEFSRETFLSEEAVAPALALAGEIETARGRVMRLYAEESHIQNQITSLTPWESLDVPLDVRDTQSSAVMLGTVPASFSMEDLERDLYASAALSQVFPAGGDREQRCFLLVCHTSALEFAYNVLRSYNFTRAVFKGMTGTAASNLALLREKLEAVRREIQEAVEVICAFEDEKDRLKLCLDRLTLEIAQEEARQRLILTDTAFSLEGWVTAPEEEALKTLLAGYACAYEITDPETPEDVPIKLRNNRVTEPFMMVTEMYSLPAYDGIDPNPLMMPFFTLFFGFMYADLGYGLVLILISLLQKRKAKPKGMLKHMTGLLGICGCSSAVIGLLTGGFFGDLIPTVAEMAGFELNLGPVFGLLTDPILDPLEAPLTVLMVAMIVGAVQIIAGMAVKAWMLIRDGKPLDALFDIGSWWLLFAGVAVLALGHGYYVFLAGLLVLLLTQGRDKKGFFGKLAGGLSGIYNITAYFGDILSYSRLMALLLSGSIFAGIVNMLGALTGSIPILFVIALVGHVFNMLINIVGTYVHSARLQYLEYFGKFYEEGGRPFSPLEINTKYVDIM